MDVFTASSALILVQICVALVVAGVCYVVPHEKCTRYWAVSAALIAAGVLIAVANADTPRYAILLVGNTSIIAGMVLQWCGIRAFYRTQPGYPGWIVGMAFFILFALLLFTGAPPADRSLLVAATVLTILILYFHELWTGHRRHRSFATALTLGATAFLVLSYASNVVAAALKAAEFTTTTTSPLAVTLFYIVPTAGTFLLSSGFLLLFERLVADKHHLAMHDEMTGVMNRRAIIAGAEREVARAMRMHQPLAVAYLDIDHFKQVNDQYGHKAGDKVIIEVAEVLKKTCRTIELVGRYGGEEFCIILPGVSRGSATVFGERLVNAIRQHRFRDGKAMTISVGLAAFNGNENDCSWMSLIAQADNELYKAKASGRDRFCVSL